ncbi:ABC transporter substrate-binding protein [Caballeronia sp. LZ034LL]|uniref:ABC transporter substrate-binding protein n=1 Tax=Caballeronia sp. LZ034LL TaxID=3038567 RepID=UPI0028634764|nr:ABC transporter substrate-binding protein [Caballeronia sp. LZ034LL]MDR5835718.1 ABC transporter substrate-binding protein [Caballeronia sp. LZ034LL]
MNQVPLDIAFWNYDRVQALRDGTVGIEGVEARYHTERIVTQIFEGMLRARRFDVSELGMTYLLRAIDSGEDLLALPVFLNRCFRHSAIYVNKASGIESPADLAGKRIGELALYGHDAGVMAKGMLSDEHGFDPAQCRWLIGGIDFPMDPIDFVERPHPAGIDVEWASKEVDLGQLLEAGEIDALISADIPACVLRGSPNVGRLFENFVEMENDYFARTGIFPIMHTVALRRSLVEEQPEIVKTIYRGFCLAKDAAREALTKGMTFNNTATMVPWLTDLMQRNLKQLGDDWWPYGIERNRKALNAILRYHHEQGLTRRRHTIEDLFVPYLLAT